VPIAAPGVCWPRERRWRTVIIGQVRIIEEVQVQMLTLAELRSLTLVDLIERRSKLTSEDFAREDAAFRARVSRERSLGLLPVGA
jgi:hypothetical protein